MATMASSILIIQVLILSIFLIPYLFLRNVASYIQTQADIDRCNPFCAVQLPCREKNRRQHNDNHRRNELPGLISAISHLSSHLPEIPVYAFCNTLSGKELEAIDFQQFPFNWICQKCTLDKDSWHSRISEYYKVRPAFYSTIRPLESLD